MIGLDTNVLVRFLVEDDPGQTATAKELIEEIVERDERAFLSDVVLCELVWVLRSSYRLPKDQITETLHYLLRSRHLEFSDRDHLEAVIRSYGEGSGDFADYVIRELAEENGCSSVATFDRALHSEPGFLALT